MSPFMKPSDDLYPSIIASLLTRDSRSIILGLTRRKCCTSSLFWSSLQHDNHRLLPYSSPRWELNQRSFRIRSSEPPETHTGQQLGLNLCTLPSETKTWLSAQEWRDDEGRLLSVSPDGRRQNSKVCGLFREPVRWEWTQKLHRCLSSFKMSWR